MIKQNPSSYESHNSIVISDIKEKEGGDTTNCQTKNILIHKATRQRKKAIHEFLVFDKLQHLEVIK